MTLQDFIEARYTLDAYYNIEKICMNLWWFEAKCLSLQHESITARGCSGDQSGDAFSQQCGRSHMFKKRNQALGGRLVL